MSSCRCCLPAFSQRCLRAQSTLPPHRHIVRYITSEFRNAPDYVQVDILMEWCPGGSAVNKLKEAQEAGSRIPEAVILRWLRDVCAALAHMHSQSPPIAHRDLKAENMLLAADGSVKLCDFGSSTTRAGVYDTFAVRILATPPICFASVPCLLVFHGVFLLIRWNGLQEIAEVEAIVDRTTTMHYRAPELADLHVMPRNRIDEKVDIWALGVLAYRLAFFVTPFEDAAGNALRMGILSGKYKIPGDSPYSDVLHGFIHTCLEVDPAKRPSVFDIREMFWPGSAAASSAPTAGLTARLGLSGGQMRPHAVHTATVVSSSTPPITQASPSVQAVWNAPPQHAQLPPPPEQLVEIEGSNDDGWPQGTTDFQDIDLSSEHPAGPPAPPRAADDSELLAGNAAAFAMLGLGGEHESRSAPATPTAGPPVSHHTPSPVIHRGARSQQPPRHVHQTDAAKPHQSTPKPQHVSVRGELSDFITTGAFTATPVEGEPIPDSTSAKVIRGAQTVMESVQTRVLGMMGAERDKFRWVIKATSLSPGPAKLKYLRYLVVDAWETRSGGALVQYLSRRPVKSEASVAVKSECVPVCPCVVCGCTASNACAAGAARFGCVDEAVAPRSARSTIQVLE
jgi:serine/threonine protein kinase